MLPIIGGFLWYQSFFFDHVIPDFPFKGNEMPLYYSISKWLNPYPLISSILGFSFVMLIAFLITRLNKKYMIIERRTYLLPLVIIVLSAFYRPSQFLNPGLLSTVFLLFAIESLFDCYKNESDLINLFNASAYISIGSLFYFNLIYFMIFIWAGMVILKPFSLKEFFKSIIGLITPYFFCMAYFFMTDNSKWFVERISVNFIPINRTMFFDLPYYVFFLFLLLFIIIASFRLLADFSRLKIGTRKYFVILFWVFMISIILLGISPLVFMEIMPLMAVPLSFLFTYHLVTTRSYWLGNIIVMVAIILLAAIQIFPFLI